MASLSAMARGRFKTSKKRTSSNNMAKRKGSKSKSRSGSSSGSGRILGLKIPVLGKVFGNKTVQKAFMGAGAVSLAISIAAILNNQQVNKALNNKIVRVGLAVAAGDVTGGLVQVVKESPQLLGRSRGNDGQQGSLVPAAGNGLA